jgi:hypothetical protein
MRSPDGDQRALLPRTRKRFLVPSAFTIHSDDSRLSLTRSMDCRV